MQNDLPWFEFKDVINKNIEDSVWIPLWWHQSTESEVKKPEIGYWEDFVFTQAVIASEEDKEELMSEDCSSFNPCHANESKRWDNEYLRADTVYNYNEPIGEYLVLFQCLGREASPKVYINQDLIFALGLIEEGGQWIRPSEGYDTVIRQTRDKEGVIYKVEIKSKYLKDYLCAKKMGAVFAAYHERVAIFKDVPNFGWPNGYGSEKIISKHARWNGYFRPMDDNGDLGLGKWSFLTSGYKEIKTDDVPKFDPRNEDDEMYSESYEAKGNLVSRYRVVGELRKIEWIAPGAISTRAGDDKEECLSFYSDADGSMKSGDELSYPPQWLWFNNDIINRILQFRGSSLSWYTSQTGSISLNADWKLHFGINRLGLINIFAKDIAELPRWQQEIWKGYNVTPDGGVSEELQMSQMKCKPANTRAAESLFFENLKYLQDGFKWASNGTPLYKEEPPIDAMKRLIHRFVVQKESDLYRLSKDIIRYTIESFNVAPLWTLVRKAEDEKKVGSMKIMERFLSKFVSEEVAHDIMAPLFYLYDLRLADAHTKLQKEINQTAINLGVRSNMLPIQIGELAIQRAAIAFARILSVFAAEYKKQNRFHAPSSC
jgi:hypothetical protein